MSIDYYSNTVRVQYTHRPLDGDDVIVEQLVNGDWITVTSLNSMSNDYAYSEAQKRALWIVQKGAR